MSVPPPSARPATADQRRPAFRIKAAIAVLVAAGLAVFGLDPGGVPAEPSAVPFRQYAGVATETDATPYAVATTVPQWQAFWPGASVPKTPPAFDPARHTGVAIPVQRDAARGPDHVSVSRRGDRVVVVIDETAHGSSRVPGPIILRIDRPGATVSIERRVRD